MTTPPPSATASDATPLEVHAYISDMLSQLADMARGVGDRRLESAMRTLALETAADGTADKGAPQDAAG